MFIGLLIMGLLALALAKVLETFEHRNDDEVLRTRKADARRAILGDRYDDRPWMKWKPFLSMPRQ